VGLADLWLTSNCWQEVCKLGEQLPSLLLLLLLLLLVLLLLLQHDRNSFSCCAGAIPDWYSRRIARSFVKFSTLQRFVAFLQARKCTFLFAMNFW
jgi:hypothetical protein